MLAYAFYVLKQKNYDRVAAESFEHEEDLMAAILSIGVAQQVKQGLYREYVSQKEDLITIRGKIAFQETLQNRMQHKKKI